MKSMKPLDPLSYPDSSRPRIAFIAAGLLVAALLLCPAAQLYAASGTRLPATPPHTWLTQINTLWADLWTTVKGLVPAGVTAGARATTTTDVAVIVGATSDPPTDTTGDGGFDSGGDGGFLDPNGGSGF